MSHCTGTSPKVHQIVPLKSYLFLLEGDKGTGIHVLMYD